MGEYVTVSLTYFAEESHSDALFETRSSQRTAVSNHNLKLLRYVATLNNHDERVIMPQTLEWSPNEGKTVAG